MSRETIFSPRHRSSTIYVVVKVDRQNVRNAFTNIEDTQDDIEVAGAFTSQAMATEYINSVDPSGLNNNRYRVHECQLNPRINRNFWIQDHVTFHPEIYS